MDVSLYVNEAKYLPSWCVNLMHFPSEDGQCQTLLGT